MRRAVCQRWLSFCVICYQWLYHWFFSFSFNSIRAFYELATNFNFDFTYGRLSPVDGPRIGSLLLFYIYTINDVVLFNRLFVLSRDSRRL